MKKDLEMLLPRNSHICLPSDLPESITKQIFKWKILELKNSQYYKAKLVSGLCDHVTLTRDFCGYFPGDVLSLYHGVLCKIQACSSVIFVVFFGKSLAIETRCDDDPRVSLYRIPACTQRARFTGTTWGPSGADRTQMGPMLSPWTLLSGYALPPVGQLDSSQKYKEKNHHRFRRGNIDKICFGISFTVQSDITNAYCFHFLAIKTQEVCIKYLCITGNKSSSCDLCCWIVGNENWRYGSYQENM